MKARGLAWLLLGVIGHAQPNPAAPGGKPAPPAYPERFHVGRAATVPNNLRIGGPVSRPREDRGRNARCRECRC